MALPELPFKINPTANNRPYKGVYVVQAGNRSALVYASVNKTYVGCIFESERVRDFTQSPVWFYRGNGYFDPQSSECGSVYEEDLIRMDMLGRIVLLRDYPEGTEYIMTGPLEHRICWKQMSQTELLMKLLWS